MTGKKLTLKKNLSRIEISNEIIMDAEQIAIGGYVPLKGFMLKSDFESVLDKMRLANGQIWSLPVTLDISEKLAASVKTGDEVLLTDRTGEAVAVLMVEQIYPHDKSLRCKSVYGTEDIAHPGAARVMAMADMLIGGHIVEFLKGFSSPIREAMMTPGQTRAYFKRQGWKTIAAFHTRNVVHRAHEYLQRYAMEYVDGLLIHPVAGDTKAGDFKKDIIIKTYRKLIDAYYPRNKVLLAALGIGMQFAGPREAVFHALVRKNYGCTHIVIGRDHAGAGGYYDKYAAHKIFSELPPLGITPLLFKGPFYCKRCESIVTENTCAHGKDYTLEVSGTLIRKLIKEKQKLPKWLMRPEIADLLEGSGVGAFS